MVGFCGAHWLGKMSQVAANCCSDELKMNESKPKKKRKYCCIKGCMSKYENDEDNIQFYHFPTTKIWWRADRSRKWIEAVIKHNNLSNDWEPKKYNMICSAHFVGGRKHEHPLHPAYNPTIFPGDYRVKGVKAVARFDRKLQRDLNKNTIVATSSPSVSTKNKAKELSLTKNHNNSIKNIKIKNEPKLLQDNSSILSKGPEFIKVEENYCNDSYIDDLLKKALEVKNFACQVNLANSTSNFYDYMMCNLKIENNLNCAEIQVNLKSKPENKNQTLQLTSKNQTFKFGKPATPVGLATPVTPVVRSVQFHGIASIHSNNQLRDFCGVTFDIFNLLLQSVPEINYVAISFANRLLIFLTKLKQGVSHQTLATLFDLQQITISRVFTQTLQSFVNISKDRIQWLDKENIKSILPESFKSKYSECRAIVDCVEIQIEIPNDEEEKRTFYSVYKNCDSFKVFIVYAPNGFVMFKSECYGGQKSDQFIAADCGFLDFIKPGDVILANKEFPNIKNALETKKAIFITQKFSEDPEQLSLFTHIKQCSLLKSFKILQFLPAKFLLQINDIVTVCCFLINLEKQKQILKK